MSGGADGAGGRTGGGAPAGPGASTRGGAPAGPATTLAELQELERRYAIATYVRQPVQFVRGAGVRLWDSDGNEYLDFLAGISVLNVGHCHPRVVEAVRDQVARLTHVSNLYYTEPALRLCQDLSESSLGGKVFLTNSGAEAVEAALKLMRRARPGGEIVVVEGGFHGRTYGALSATPQESKQAPFAPLVPGFVVVRKDPAALAAAVSERTAGVLVEPIQGEGGIHVLSDELLRAARSACERTGAALVFDEIQCGMGRTGTLWAHEQTAVQPDALVAAKGLGGGLPVGALVTGPRLADTFQAGDHGSTFAGGPVIAAAARVALQICSEPGLLDRVSALGQRLAAGLEALPFVREVRGRGLMVGIDLAEGHDAPELARRALLEQRLVVNATGPGTIRLEPPLIVSEQEIDDAVNRLRKVVRG
jgi:predicted acetylornithine/succinylornithine family transaminase